MHTDRTERDRQTETETQRQRERERERERFTNADSDYLHARQLKAKSKVMARSSHRAAKCGTLMEFSAVNDVISVCCDVVPRVTSVEHSRQCLQR